MKPWTIVISMLITVGCQRGASAPNDGPKFELQGFTISHKEEKESYGAGTSSIRVSYTGRGNLVYPALEFRWTLHWGA